MRGADGEADAGAAPARRGPEADQGGAERRAYARRSTDRLRRETLDHLVQGVAHDLNNVLTLLLTQLDRLEHVTTPSPDVRGAIDAMYAAVEHGASLSDAIAMLSRDHLLERDLVEVDRVIHEAAELIRSAVPPEVTVTLDLRATGCQAVILRGSLERVLLNATLNAVRAMPAGGSLTIGSRVAVGSGDGGGPTVVVEVIDDGIGIDAATRRQAFEPGYTTRRSAEGHGLGLAACRQLVTATGGTVDLTGSPGQGSVLAIRYPVADPEADAAPRPERRADPDRPRPAPSRA